MNKKALWLCLVFLYPGFSLSLAAEQDCVVIDQPACAVVHPKDGIRNGAKEASFLEKLTTDAQELERDINEMVTLVCSARLINFDEKLRHERIVLFLRSLCIDVQTWLDVARGVAGNDQKEAILIVKKMTKSLSAFVEAVNAVLGDITSVVLAFEHGAAAIDDVHELMLEALVELVLLFKKTWNAIVHQKKEQTVFCADSRALSYHLLASCYQVSIPMRWWSGSLLDQALAIIKTSNHAALLKEYHVLVSAIVLARQDSNKIVLAEKILEITTLIEAFECEKSTFDGSLLDVLFDGAVFNLLELKVSCTSMLGAPDIVAHSEKTEAYVAHQHVLADQRFRKLYQASVFKPYLKKYLTALELYFGSEEHNLVDVMYEVYDALYGISLLKTREEKGFFKKMVWGTPEYLVLLDQMHDVLKKAYEDLRTQLLPKPGFLQKLLGTDWLDKDKIKNFVCEKSGEAVVELAQKCVGQRFDTKESAMVYAMSIGAPLTLLAALKWLVPNLPQQLQKKVHEFVKALPLAQNDDQKLAQLIRDNPEVVQAFLAQDSTLVETLMNRLEEKF